MKKAIDTDDKASKEISANDLPWGDLDSIENLLESRVYSQNMDFAGFPVLMERTYAKLEVIDPCFRRKVPYCAFQHVYTGMLNATIIDHVKVNNCDDRFANEESPINLIPPDMLVPAPIAEYFKMVRNASIPGGIVCINLPDGGVPHGRIPKCENLPEIPSGSFGRITEHSHNAYECYVSPYVTSRLIEETRKQYDIQVFKPWNPLPDGAFPANCLPNRNLLGYRDVECLTYEGRQSLAQVYFPDSDTMEGRLRWCSELADTVSAHLNKLADRYRMIVYRRPEHGTNAAVSGWMNVEIAGADTIAHNTQRLATISGTIRSNDALESAQCAILRVFCMRRERTATAKGLCYATATGIAPGGWDPHINRNYMMLEPFDLMIGTDLPELRSTSHVQFVEMENRSLLVDTWLNRFEIKKKACIAITLI